MTRALMEAIERRDVDAAREYLASGAPVEGSPWAWLIRRRGATPLMAAVRAGCIELAKLLLDHGADPNRETRFWSAPLALATHCGDRAMVELLLHRGADVDPPGRRHPSPLQKAAWYNRPELVALLLERGADPDRVLDERRNSLVRVRAPILAMLIAAGGHASPSIMDMVQAEMARSGNRGEPPSR